MADRDVPFRDKAIETASREEIERIQTAGLKKQVEHALNTPFYRERYKNAGITSPAVISTIADIRKLPFTPKTIFVRPIPTAFLPFPARKWFASMPRAERPELPR